MDLVRRWPSPCCRRGASAPAGGFVQLLACRAIAGIGSGVYLALGIAACGAMVTPGQRGKAIAAIMGGMARGTVLVVPLSLLLAERLGWASALWLVTALGILALLGLCWKLPALPPAPAITLGRKLGQGRHCFFGGGEGAEKRGGHPSWGLAHQ